jgi:hypothetical protein
MRGHARLAFARDGSGKAAGLMRNHREQITGSADQLAEEKSAHPLSNKRGAAMVSHGRHP